MGDKSFVKYTLSGFSGLEIQECSEPVEVKNKVVDSYMFSKDLSSLTIYLKPENYYELNAELVEDFKNQLLYKLLSFQNVENNEYSCIIEQIVDADKNKLAAFDSIQLEHVLIGKVSLLAKDFYKELEDTQVTINACNRGVYQRVLCIMQNPNKVMQFMQLYEVLLELTSYGKNLSQQNVIDFFRNTVKLSPNCFVPSTDLRKIDKNTGKPKEEDCYTHLRNEIGHSQDTKDFSTYRKLGEKINNGITHLSKIN